MAARRSRRRRKSYGCLRAMGLTLLILAAAGVAFFLTSVGNERVTGLTPQHETRQSARHSETTDLSHRDTEPSSQPSESARPQVIPPPVEIGGPEQTPIRPSDEEPSSSETVLPLVTTDEFARGSASSSEIALTFDAGASPAPTPKILDVLAKYNVHSTFFLTGKWIAKNPKLSRRIVTEGHEIGNHTYSHKSLTDLDEGKITDEVEKTDKLVEELTGHSTKPLLRVPYGARDDRVKRILAELGYRSIYWDLDSWDSVKKGITPEEIEQRVLGKVRNGSIVLLHCGSDATADALDSLLEKLIADGYRPVTVSELMR